MTLLFLDHLFYDDEEDVEEDEFKCLNCGLIQSNNWCFNKCDTKNSCGNCVGNGGDDNTEGNENPRCHIARNGLKKDYSLNMHNIDF